MDKFAKQTKLTSCEFRGLERREVMSGDEHGECNLLMLRIEGEDIDLWISDDDTERLGLRIKKVME